MRNRATLRFHCYTLEEVSSNRACRSNTFFVPSRFNPLYSSLISPFFFPFLVSFIAHRSDFRHCCSTFSRIFYPPSSYLVILFLFRFSPSPFSSHTYRIQRRSRRSTIISAYYFFERLFYSLAIYIFSVFPFSLEIFGIEIIVHRLFASVPPPSLLLIDRFI